MFTYGFWSCSFASQHDDIIAYNFFQIGMVIIEISAFKRTYRQTIMILGS